MFTLSLLRKCLRLKCHAFCGAIGSVEISIVQEKPDGNVETSGSYAEREVSILTEFEGEFSILR